MKSGAIWYLLVLLAVLSFVSVYNKIACVSTNTQDSGNLSAGECLPTGKPCCTSQLRVWCSVPERRPLKYTILRMNRARILLEHAGLGVQCSSSPVSPTLEETARRWDWFVQVVVAATQYDVPVMAVPVSIVVARCQVQPVRDYSDGSLVKKRAIFKRQATYSQVVHLCQN